MSGAHSILPLGFNCLAIFEHESALSMRNAFLSCFAAVLFPEVIIGEFEVKLGSKSDFALLTDIHESLYAACPSVGDYKISLEIGFTHLVLSGASRSTRLLCSCLR